MQCYGLEWPVLRLLVVALAMSRSTLAGRLAGSARHFRSAMRSGTGLNGPAMTREAPAPAAAPVLAQPPSTSTLADVAHVSTHTATTTPVELPAVSIILEFKHIKYADVEDSGEGQGREMRLEIARVVREIIGEQCSPDLFDNVILPNETFYKDPQEGLLQTGASQRSAAPAPAGAMPVAPGTSPSSSPAMSPAFAPASAPAVASPASLVPAGTPLKTPDSHPAMPNVAATPAAPATKPLFDCEAGFDLWFAGWSAEKMDWCCTNEAKGCTTTTKPPFDCEAGLDLWFAGWSAEKMNWCCANQAKGCTKTHSPLFDCAAGFANWEAGWSTRKKHWCCASEEKGCETPEQLEVIGSEGILSPALAPGPAPAPAPPGWAVAWPTEWWLSVSGNCTTIGYCVQSPNYPQKYGNDQGCNITLNQSVRPRLTGTLFSAESNWDVLTVNGQEYSGTSGPVGVVPTATVTWSSDHVKTGLGWQLCFQDRPITLTVTTTPKPMVYNGCPVKVFAQFFPGSTKILDDRPFQRILQRHEDPFDSFAQVSGEDNGSVFLEVIVTEKPNTGNEELPAAMEIIKKTQGDFFVALKNAMRKFVDFKPIVAGMYVNWVLLKPYSVNTCEAKMEKLVGEFSKSYTRRLVPWALYNECTNFMASLSFSHDPLVTELDRSKCRAWTHNFMQKWNYGKGVTEVANPIPFDCNAGLQHRDLGWSPAKKCWCCRTSGLGCDARIACPEPETSNKSRHIDYKCWCQEVCESKFGMGAPVCHVTSGAKNYYQPV